jgi:diguanylate cyclase
MIDQNSCYRGEDGISLARSALALLKTHAIPVSPANYEVWLTHIAGANPSLSYELQKQIDSAQPFTDAINEALFERFFSGARLTVELVQTSESIARELSSVVSTLRDAGTHTAAYADSLQNAAVQIEDGAETTDLTSFLKNLAAATRAVMENNRQLAQQMAKSSQQVETLQTALQAVKVEASTDGLTGLANRRYFDEVLRDAVRADPGGSLCLIMCDIDHFKRLNDTWGHLIGDQVIRHIAAVLRRHTPAHGIAARYGGEEFAIVLPQSAASDALGVADAILSAVRSRTLTQRSTGTVIGTVTISIGVAQHRVGESVADLIGRADACLYASKHAGRDRISTDQALSNAAAA